MKKLTCIIVALIICFTTTSYTYAESLSIPKKEADILSKEKGKFYDYAHNEAEYSVRLPEAPRVRTIWGTEKTPYFQNEPKAGSIGELAIFKRIDVDNYDVFDVKVIFLKAEQSFLKSLNDKKIERLIKRDLKGLSLESEKFEYKIEENNEILKHGIFTGFSVDKNNEPFYYAQHFLSGEDSILAIKIKYNIKNKKFAEYYKSLVENIKYLPL